MKQISGGEECETDGSTPEIEVMTSGAMLESPAHPWKQMKRFANVTKSDNDQTSHAHQLKEQPDRLSSTN
jgi:hypothetical protein